MTVTRCGLTAKGAANYVDFIDRLRMALLLLPIAVICLFTACQKESVNDDQLATGIKANFFSDDTTKSANLNVAVKDGVVTLTGEVPSSDIKVQAVKIVNGTAGVKRVDDQIKVNPALAMNQPPPESSQTRNSRGNAGATARTGIVY